MSIGRVLKDLREKSNESQAEVAKEIPVTPQTYGKYENDSIITDMHTLEKLAEHFKVPVSIFFANENILKGPRTFLTVWKLVAVFELKCYKLDLLHEQISKLDENSQEYIELTKEYNIKHTELKKIASKTRKLLKEDVACRELNNIKV
jgi:transcriptional regulator with XRE-family HTH domain